VPRGAGSGAIGAGAAGSGVGGVGGRIAAMIVFRDMSFYLSCARNG